MEIENQGPEKTRLTEEDKWFIVVAIKHFGLAYTEVEKKFQWANRSTISKIYKKYLKEGNVDSQNFKGGRPKVENVEENIIAVMKDEMYSSSTMIAEALESKYNQKVSKETICRILKKNGLQYGKVHLIHKLTEKNLGQRVQHCKQMLRRKMANIIYTDETVISIRNNNLMIWYSKDLPKFYQQQEQQYKDSYDHIWAGICRRGKIKLFFHNKKVGSDQYIECLKSYLKPFIKNQYKKEKAYLLQDGAPSHTSNKTKNWLNDNKIEYIQNSPWSPDLNPIGIIWANMKRQFNRQHLIKRQINRPQTRTAKSSKKLLKRSGTASHSTLSIKAYHTLEKQ